MTQPESPPNSGEQTLPHPPRPAQDLSGRVLGDFRVERLLGHGGMGEVYLARQLSLDRPVALKVIRPELLSNPTYLARFEAEAWAAAKLNHPNIVHIYALGALEGLRYIAMEYVAGTNLRDYLAKKGPPDLPLALSIMKQAAQAVGAAGEVGLIHRDIKPENLLLTRKGKVKVADFGLSRGPESDRLHLTQPGLTLGTPLYMSPEQVQGQVVDHRSDLYSLGVTFYHMLAGFPPFQGETTLALALKHVHEAPVSLAVHRPDLPPELVRLVMKLLEKRPADRYQSAAELLRDLAKLRESLQAASTAMALSLPSQPALPATAVPSSAPTQMAPRERWRPRLEIRLGPKAFLAAAVLGLASGALIGWLGRAPDLLAASAPPPEGLPGLWMAPWQDVPARPSPEAQYRYAQLEVPEGGREAAWLAVPGRFPDSQDWAAKAYVQLARYLLRHRDAPRLDALAIDLERWGRAHHRDHYQRVAAVARAAARAIQDEPVEVVDKLGDLKFTTMDPALVELSLEATLTALRSANGVGDQSLIRLRNELTRALQMGTLDASGLPKFP
ncbi:MAG: protein kinase [Isosphaeraceae bacterium]|nr:protein kinase [Isosphaeraceae bacterium]